MSNFNTISFCILFLIICSLCGWYTGNYLRNITCKHESKEKYKIKIEYSGFSDAMKEIKKLETLQDFIKTIKMDSWAKERLIKDINNEIDYQKRKLYEVIGENIVKKEIKE